MAQQTTDPRDVLIDPSGLSFHNLEEISGSVFRDALHEILGSAAAPGDAIAAFDSVMPPERPVPTAER